jgi:hypothetical protein
VIVVTRVRRFGCLRRSNIQSIFQNCFIHRCLPSRDHDRRQRVAENVDRNKSAHPIRLLGPSPADNYPRGHADEHLGRHVLVEWFTARRAARFADRRRNSHDVSLTGYDCGLSFVATHSSRRRPARAHSPPNDAPATIPCRTFRPTLIRQRGINVPANSKNSGHSCDGAQSGRATGSWMPDRPRRRLSLGRTIWRRRASSTPHSYPCGRRSLGSWASCGSLEISERGLP